MDSEADDTEMYIPLFDRVCALDPSLKHPTQVIVIGLRHCPFSSMARELIKKRKKLENNHKFILFDESLALPYRNAGEFSSHTGYRGSFPIVFALDPQGEMVHIGGATNLRNLLTRGW
jgi:hypothetical protein